MIDSKLQDIAENILSLKRLLFKKVIKRGFTNSIIPHDAHCVLNMLEKSDSATMSEIGKELCFPKPNVTPLINKLVDTELVERISDSHDRRVVRIKITDKGVESLDNARNILKSYIKSKLVILSEDDLVKLADSFNTIKDIIQKIQ